MGIPASASVNTEPERMVFWQTEVICSSIIHERQRSRGKSVPGVRRNHIEGGL